MINITRKEDCVGCNACVQRCPKQCISMNEDEQGFLYPLVDVSECIECGLCEKVCPVINQSDERLPKAAYAAKNKEEYIQMNSSSGGVFYALAKRVIDEGGVVFGARFNDKWEVVHDYTENAEGIKAFQTSKYVQSRIGTTYSLAETFLKDGRRVLFSGTPCQIAGLKHFLRKEYENLLTVDIICHGVPSPRVWREYLNYITRPSGASKNTESQPYQYPPYDIPPIRNISFRDKRLGWKKYGIAIRFAAPEDDRNSEPQSAITQKEEGADELFEIHTKNLFMQCFLKDLCLRPSCYACPSKYGKSHSDITLADFWGIEKKYPNLYNEGLYSLLLQGSKKGESSLQDEKIFKQNVDLTVALSGNPAFSISAKKPKEYKKFWKNFEKKGVTVINRILKDMQPSLVRRALRKAYQILLK